ncbi:MAG: ATP-grasp domain-containing protein [Blastocatellia bacterium]
MPHSLKIGVLAEARYLAQSQPTGLSAKLNELGHQITMIDPQKAFYVMGDDGWFEGLDVIVGRGRSWALLALLGWAETRGTLTINRREAIASVHNKAHMSIAFASAGIPIPQTFFGSVEQLTREIPRSSYPIILKPIFGDNSRGLLVINSPEEMAATNWPEPVALAQRYFQTDGYDLKLYGIGDEIWAVRKASPFNTRKDDVQSKDGLAPITPELTDLGRRCGRLFGLELFGVDCIETEEGVLVIEINDYPNYTNVPNANERLAEYVAQRAMR